VPSTSDIAVLGISVPVPLLAALISVAGTVFTNVLWQLWLQWWTRARLSVKRFGVMYQQDWCSFIVIVENRGRTTARVCVGQMSMGTFASRDPTAGPTTPEAWLGYVSDEFSDINLPWVRDTSPAEISIHPRQSQRLLLAAIRRGTPELIVPGEEGTEHPRVAIGAEAGFDFVVRICADNSPPVEAAGTIKGPGWGKIQLGRAHLVPRWRFWLLVQAFRLRARIRARWQSLHSRVDAHRAPSAEGQADDKSDVNPRG
jgi:hypothetical protein